MEVKTEILKVFESAIQKICEKFREKLTHAELVGTLDTIKMGYHIRTIQSFEETEQCEAPAIIPGSVTITDKPEPVKSRRIKKHSGSPLPAEVADG